MQKTLKEILQVILEIQKLDMHRIRLSSRKKHQLKELEHIGSLRKELLKQQGEKEAEISELNRLISSHENKRDEILELKKKRDAQQASIKKVEEYNRLNQELLQYDRELKALEQVTSDLIDRRNLEEEFKTKIKDSLQQSEESSKNLEVEIVERIRAINQEGTELTEKREALSKTADPEILAVYQRLLNNKKDQVVVTLENRNCSGCHIALTAQHENSVIKAELHKFSDDSNIRKVDRLVFCEHCSRIHIHHTPEVVEAEAEGATPKRRRRRAATVS